MAARTNTEAIRKLEESVARLDPLMDMVRDENKRLRDEQARVAESLKQAEVRVAVLETHRAHLEKSLDESDRRRWAVLLAFFGSLLTLVINLILLALGKK